jgi:hypothetical protein
MESHLLSIERRLRRDQAIAHGLDHTVHAMLAAVTLVATTLGLGDIHVVDAKWLSRPESARRPLMIRFASESAKKQVRTRARELKPDGVSVNDDLCYADREALRTRAAQRRARPPPEAPVVTLPTSSAPPTHPPAVAPPPSPPAQSTQAPPSTVLPPSASAPSQLEPRPDKDTVALDTAGIPSPEASPPESTRQKQRGKRRRTTAPTPRDDVISAEQAAAAVEAVAAMPASASPEPIRADDECPLPSLSPCPEEDHHAHATTTPAPDDATESSAGGDEPDHVLQPADESRADGTEEEEGAPLPLYGPRVVWYAGREIQFCDGRRARYGPFGGLYVLRACNRRTGRMQVIASRDSNSRDTPWEWELEEEE